MSCNIQRNVYSTEAIDRCAVELLKMKSSLVDEDDDSTATFVDRCIADLQAIDQSAMVDDIGEDSTASDVDEEHSCYTSNTSLATTVASDSIVVEASADGNEEKIEIIENEVDTLDDDNDESDDDKQYDCYSPNSSLDSVDFDTNHGEVRDMLLSDVEYDDDEELANIAFDNVLIIEERGQILKRRRRRRSPPVYESSNEDLAWDGYEEFLNIRPDSPEPPPTINCNPFRRREFYCIASLTDNYDSYDAETITDEPPNRTTIDTQRMDTINYFKETPISQETLSDQKTPIPTVIKTIVKPSAGTRVITVIKNLAAEVLTVQQNLLDKMKRMALKLVVGQRPQSLTPQSLPTSEQLASIALHINYDRLQWLLDSSVTGFTPRQVAGVERICRRQAIHVGHVLLQQTAPDDLRTTNHTTSSMLLDKCPPDADTRRCGCRRSSDRECRCGPGLYFMQGFADFVVDHLDALGYWGLLIAFVKAREIMWRIFGALQLDWLFKW